MIVISKAFSLPQLYDTGAIAPLKDIVFVDIETTGFTPNSSSVYLIGAVYHAQMEWHLRQWFADSLTSEQAVLSEFFRFLSGFQVIVTFNGETFDLPYLEKCAASYGIDCPISSLASFDIYRRVRPLKDLLSLPNLRLVTIEHFLGIPREDAGSGGDMIEVYKRYLETGDEGDYTSLLRHNEDDLKALPQVLPILSYLEIFRSNWTLAGHSLNRETGCFTAILDCSVKVPVAFSFAGNGYTISVRANQIIVEVQAFLGDLKYFFSDFRDYYFLPEEDRAIHKKVGQYVDREFREQATAATCYTHKQGIFLPVRSEDMFEVYKEDYHAKQLYTLYREDDEFLLAVLHNLLYNILD